MTTILEHIADEVGKQIKAERESQGTSLTTDINSILEILKNGGASTEVVAENLNGQPYMTYSTSPSSTLTGTAGAIICHTSFANFQSSRLLDFNTLPTWDRTSTTNPSFLNYLNDAGKMLHKTYTKTHVVTIQNNGVNDVFFIDGVETPTLELAKGNVYTFDWSADLTKPFRLSETSDGTNATGSEHTNGVVVDTTNGTTTFTIADNEVEQLFYYSDGTAGMGGELTLKIPPYHTEQNDGHGHAPANSSGLLVNMINECTSRRDSPTGKVLFLCDTPSNDYMFYARSGMFQFLLEKACYWAGVTLEVPTGSEVVTRQPSYFYNAQYNQLAYNHSWFLGDHYGYIETDQFFKNNSTISSATGWRNYFNDYDCVIVLGVSKSVWFPSNAINGLAKARDTDNVGLIGLTDDSYYTRNINTIFAPYNISWQGRFSQLNTTDHYLISEIKAQGYNHNYLFDGLHDDYHLSHTITDSYLAINSGNSSNITINLQIDQLRDELTSVDEYSPAVDTEFRNLNRSIAGNSTFPVEQGDVINITSINPSKIIWSNENGVIRQLLHSQEGTIYRRMDSSTSFADEYDSSLSDIGTGSYSIDAQIEILQSGDHVTGWLDLYKLDERINSNSTAGVIGKSDEVDLPIPEGDGEIYWVTDQDLHVYSKDGDWYKMSDDSLFKDMPTRDIDMYLLLGQSNMHGYADLSGAPTDITSQKSDVFFRTAWHHGSSNATTQLYESDWVDNVTAGNTRGDDGVSVIGGSSNFGPEIGFAHEAKINGLFGTNTPAIFKYAVGASSLFSDSTDGQGNELSDWDTTADLDNRNGDCWRGYKTAFENAVKALQDKGHRVFVKDVIWYQGESDGQKANPEGTIQTKLKSLWDNIRQHMLTLNLSYANTNMIVTRISGSSGQPVSWGDEYKRFSDAYIRIGLVDATIYSPGNNVHLAQDGMFGIGKAFAREAKRINDQADHTIAHEIPGTDLVNAVSANESTITETSGYVTQVDDLSSNGNNYTAESASTIELVESGSDLLYNEKVFKFDGDTDVLDTGNITGLDLGSKFTCYMLFNPSVNGGQDAPWSIRDFSNFDVIAPLAGNSSEYRGQFYHHTRTQGSIGYTGATAITGWNLLTWEIDTTAQTSTAWLNGTQLFSFADSGTLGADSIIHLMGNHNAPSTQGGASVLDGKFTEFIITKDNSDREKIEGAIMHRYGLARNLPANHAYREIVP